MKNDISSQRILTTVLLIVLGVAVLVAGYSQFNANSKANSDLQLQTLLNDLESASYELIGVTQSAAVGEQSAFEQLPELDTRLDQAGQQFNAGAQELGPLQLGEFNAELQSLRSSINAMLLQRDAVLFLYNQGALLEENIPQIQQAYNTVTDVMLRSNTPSAQVAESQAQVWRAETMIGGLRQILAGSDDSERDAESFRQNVLFSSNVLQGMLDGDRLLGIDRVTATEARNALAQVQSQFAETNQSVQLVLDSTPALNDARVANDQVQALAPTILDSVSELSDSVNALAGTRTFSAGWALVSGLVAVLALFALGTLISQGTRINLRKTEETNNRNQEAILRLLDEIADLGEGDLTVKATVTEDFTGAIADSINYAIDSLRGLVSQVAETAENVANSSTQTRSTSLQLADAADHQAEEVGKATVAIKDIAENIRQVSSNATQSAAEAERSVEIASNGSAVVRNTITGMDNIREQIQDTSKRIKRLGESSQEIGEIVSLIDEIADQTNILALNASIQAAMAGEAGRGFAVVADEVQRLAERAAASTKQIETLVKTIQSDTNEAVASMEQTTTEVVRGAQLANDAGKALDEIETGSNTLAELILTISKAAQEQSEQADNIADSMTVIQDISGQTLSGTTETAGLVGELADQAGDLQASIADFKLPDASNDGVIESEIASEEEAPAIEEALAEDSLLEEDDIFGDMEGDFDPDQMRDDLAALEGEDAHEDALEDEEVSDSSEEIDDDDLEYSEDEPEDSDEDDDLEFTENFEPETDEDADEVSEEDDEEARERA